jgi:hypothetical protein
MNDRWTEKLRSRGRLAVAVAFAVSVGCAGDDRATDAAEQAASSDMSEQASPAAGKEQSAPETRATAASDEGTTKVVAPEDSVDASGRIVEPCQGMKLVGLKYSPGGSTLPNKCAPFHVRNNNPYAVRCIDAMPDFHTPFAGDEYCILPPPPDLGFQVGVHPGGNTGYWDRMWAGDYSVYADAEVTKDYEVPAGGEALQNYLIDFQGGPTDEHYYYRRNFRGRYGSHHGTASFTGSPETEGWQDDGNIFVGRAGSELVTVQNAYTDFPQSTLEVSAEEEGVGIQMTLNSGLNLNLHHFNQTDKTMLRENWINAWYMPKEAVTKPAFGIYGDTPIHYPIGMELDNEGVVRATTETQVLSMWGHRHAWTARFHAWVVRKNGQQELVYDSNNWYDMPTFSYNGLAMNPEPGMGFDGASSGPLTLEPDDELHFNCHIDTTQHRADEIHRQLPATALEWANEAFSGEMCLLLGQTTGGSLRGDFSNVDLSGAKR